MLTLLGAVTWVARRELCALGRGGGTQVHKARGVGGVIVPIVCFAAAGLCRETLLLVPAALLLHDLVRGPTVAERRRALIAGPLVVAPYVCWVLGLRAILGAWPSGTVDGRLSLVPFGGLVEAAGDGTPLDAVFVLAVLAGALGALARPAAPWMRWVIAAHLALAATLGDPVWASWRDWGRVLLPMTALTILSLATRTARAAQTGGETDTEERGSPTVVPIR
jgi:hypothetical protein